jgi:hypothetical protein
MNNRLWLYFTSVPFHAVESSFQINQIIEALLQGCPLIHTRWGQRGVLVLFPDTTRSIPALVHALDAPNYHQCQRTDYTNKGKIIDNNGYNLVTQA